MQAKDLFPLPLNIEAGGDRGDNVEVVDDETLAITVARLSGPKAKERARHIIASLRVCEGLDTEYLEACDKFADVSKRKADILQRRDELAAVLARCVRRLDELCHQYNESGTEAARQGRELLAKAQS